MLMRRSAVSSLSLLRAAAGLVVFCTLGACGYKGPLYLPPPPAPDASLTAPPRTGELPEATPDAVAPDTVAPGPTAEPVPVR